MESLTELIDRLQPHDKRAEIPTVSEREETAGVPHLSRAHGGDGDSVFDKLSEIASWADILEPAGWTQVRPGDSHTLEAWRHPNATHPISAHVLKAAPWAIVNWSENSGLPVGPDQDLTKAKAYAHLHYGGDLSAAARALTRGDAVGLPPHVVEACPGATTPRTEPASVEPPEDEMPYDDPYQDQEDHEPILKLRSIRELRAHVASQGPREWLARGAWPATAYGMLGGEPKAQKTWNAEDLAVSVASNTPWLGHFEIDQPGPVVIFCGEGGEGTILRRLDAIAESKGVDADTLPITVCARAPHLSKIDHMAEFKHAVQRHRPVLVILDPLYLAARGANLRDLYEMGALLETPQHICSDQGAALMVVHHYNRSREAKGAGRFSGAGPAEWGRVLIGTDVVSRYTDKITKETKVITELEVIGGEVHDQKYRLTRKIRAEDPDDLDSPLHYHVTVTEAEVESTRIDMSGGMKPSAQRVYAVLTADPTATLSVREIGDRLADQGLPLKARTIQDALTSLGDLVSGLVIDKRGTTLWTVEEAGDDQ